MKLTKTNLGLSTLLASSIVLSGCSIANSSPSDHPHAEHDGVKKQVIKIIAEKDDNVIVKVVNDGMRNKYDFSFDELEDLDSLSAQLDDLAPELKEKVLSALKNINENDANIIEIKDAEFLKGDKESDIFVIKTMDGENSMHIEVDVEGDVVSSGEHFKIMKFLGDGKRSHKSKRHHMSMHKGENMAEVITKMIGKSDLTSEQIEKIREALDSK